MADHICAHHQLARQCPICEERAAREQAESAFAECRAALFEECAKTVQAERLLDEERDYADGLAAKLAKRAHAVNCPFRHFRGDCDCFVGRDAAAHAARRGGEKGGG